MGFWAKRFLKIYVNDKVHIGRASKLGSGVALNQAAGRSRGLWGWRLMVNDKVQFVRASKMGGRSCVDCQAAARSRGDGD